MPHALLSRGRALAALALAVCLAPAAFAGDLCVFHDRAESLRTLREHLGAAYVADKTVSQHPPDDGVTIKPGTQRDWGTIETSVTPWPRPTRRSTAQGRRRGVHHGEGPGRLPLTPRDTSRGELIG